MKKLLHAIFGCRMCEEKDKQIVYLKKLSDSLLIRQGARPVDVTPEPESKEDIEAREEREKLIERGAVFFGEA